MPGVSSGHSRKERAEGCSRSALRQTVLLRARAQGVQAGDLFVVVLTVAMHLVQLSRPPGSAFLPLFGSFLGTAAWNGVPRDAQVWVQMGAPASAELASPSVSCCLVMGGKA